MDSIYYIYLKRLGCGVYDCVITMFVLAINIPSYFMVVLCFSEINYRR